MKNIVTKTCVYSLIIALTAQLNINLFIEDFKISIAVVCFSAILFLTDDFPLLPVTCFSAVSVFLSRLLFYWLKNGGLDEALFVYMPEMSFYLCYGLLLYLYTRFQSDYKRQTNKTFLAVLLIDYLANLSELLFRLGIHPLNLKAQAGLFLVAFLRTLILRCILIIFEHYRILLLKQEHEKRYRRLLLLVSRLNSEMIWMKKNTFKIEDTMNTSYQLYHDLKSSGTDEKLSSSALSVARDIHEIKKEYLLIMRGISEALDQEFEKEGMYLNDIFRLLKDFLYLTARQQNKTLLFSCSAIDNPYTEQQYTLMSVFRNLLMNSLEAGIVNPVQITITESKKEGSYIFSITDNGPGISPDVIPEIFKAGFSTKINYSTGEVSRGLGLNLVKDLVETQMGGRISLTSVPGHTTFVVQIPIAQIEKRQEEVQL